MMPPRLATALSQIFRAAGLLLSPALSPAVCADSTGAGEGDDGCASVLLDVLAAAAHSGMHLVKLSFI